MTAGIIQTGRWQTYCVNYIKHVPECYVINIQWLRQRGAPRARAPPYWKHWYLPCYAKFTEPLPDNDIIQTGRWQTYCVNYIKHVPECYVINISSKNAIQRYQYTCTGIYHITQNWPRVQWFSEKKVSIFRHSNSGHSATVCDRDLIFFVFFLMMTRIHLAIHKERITKHKIHL